MSENSKEKKPHGWFFKNFIVGIIFLFPFAILILVMTLKGELWQDWLYSHFVFFTRINPITIFLFRYIIYPAIGCFLFPCALFFLFLKLKGEL